MNSAASEVSEKSAATDNLFYLALTCVLWVELHDTFSRKKELLALSENQTCRLVQTQLCGRSTSIASRILVGLGILVFANL